MTQRLLGLSRRQLFRSPGPERASRCRQDQAFDFMMLFAPQTLMQRIVFAVHWQQFRA